MKRKQYLLLVILFFLYACAPSVSKYRNLAEEDPEGLLEIKDSLMSAGNFAWDTAMVNILIEAHLAVSEKLETSGSLDKAVKETEKAVALNPEHKGAQYRLCMQQGKVNYNHGNIWKLWDAIGLFTKASELYSERGEPYYWMGRTYEKKDDRDFISILEAYEKAFKTLDEGPLLNDTNARIKRIENEKTTFDNFWK